MISDRMILREEATEEDVQGLARGLSMTKIRDVSSPERQTIVREITWEANSGIRLHYAADYLSASRIISVEGDDDQHFRRFIEVVVTQLRPWILDELIAQVDSCPADEPRALARAVIRLGVGAPNEYNGEIFDRIAAAMHSPDAWVRKAAIWATMYSQWPQFLPLLEDIANTDVDEAIRNDARRMVNFGKKSGNEP